MKKKTTKIIVDNKKALIIALDGKGFPSAGQIRSAADAYFGAYRTGSDNDKAGIIEFTAEALGKISLLAFLNAIGVSRNKWNSWLSAKGLTKCKTSMVAECNRVLQILEQLAVERLQTRGNVGDIFYIKSQMGWRDGDKDTSKRALQNINSDRTKEILNRMANGRK